MNTFWMCYVEGMRSPSFKHLSLDAAKEEAERLARQELGKKVYILAALEYCQMTNLVWQHIQGAEGFAGLPYEEQPRTGSAPSGRFQ